MALWRDATTGNILTNSGGSIFDATQAELEECCCGDNVLAACILERQLVAAVAEANRIDPDGTYTLAQYCAHANLFLSIATTSSGYDSTAWSLDTSWGNGPESSDPTLLTSVSGYFSSTNTGAPGYVTSEAELLALVQGFTRTITKYSQNSTGIDYQAYDGYGAGESSYDDVISAVEADWGSVAGYVENPQCFTIINKKSNTNWDAYARVCKCGLTSDFALYNGISRYMAVYLHAGDPPTYWSGGTSTFYGYSMPVTQNRWDVHVDDYKSASESNAISPAPYESEPYCMSTWILEDDCGGITRKGWEHKSAEFMYVVIDWDFECM